MFPLANVFTTLKIEHQLSHWTCPQTPHGHLQMGSCLFKEPICTDSQGEEKGHVTWREISNTMMHFGEEVSVGMTSCHPKLLLMI